MVSAATTELTAVTPKAAPNDRQTDVYQFTKTFVNQAQPDTRQFVAPVKADR